MDINSAALNDACRALECPICFEAMKAPIVLCIQGHSLCSDCKNKLLQKSINSCPECNSTFSEARNFALERISEILTVPCKNAVHGCNKIIMLCEKKSHEEFCPLRQYKCCLTKDCHWSGNRTQLLAHARENHPSHVWASAENVDINANNNFLVNLAVDKLISAYNELFRVKIRKDSIKKMRYVSVHYIGPVENCVNFSYEVSYVSKFTAHRAVFRSATHPESENIEELIRKKKCSSITEKRAQNFVVDGKLKYNVRIRRT